MTAEFLNFYFSNLEVLSNEITKNRSSIEQLSEKIKTLTTDVEQKLRAIFDGELNDTAEQNYQIKIVYLLIRQIQKCDDEKRTLARQACDILDRYLVSIDDKLKSAKTYHGLSDNDQRVGLFNTLLSIKAIVNEPVEGNAAVIDLMKKVDNGRVDDSKESNGMNVESFISDRSIDSLQFSSDGATKMSKSSKYHLIHHPIDNLQEFTDKIREICSGIKNRCPVDGLLNLNSETLSSNSHKEEEASTSTATEENDELCHCRKESSGRMVACDNANCKTIWFHFECVGLYVAPTGLWFCPHCIIFEEM